MHALIDFPAAHRPTGREYLAFEHPPTRWLLARTLDEVTAVVAAADTAARAGAWVVGMVAYEAAAAFDAALHTRPATEGFPLAAFAVFEEAPTDGLTDGPTAEPNAGPDAQPRAAVLAADGFHCGRWREERGRGDILADITALQDEIAAGRHYQTNLTMRLAAPFSGSGAALFHALHRSQPEGYGLYLDGGDWQLASVSPELFFDWRAGQLTTRPMKGTAPRHADPTRDAAAAAAMTTSPKERAENLMIVDLLRNDLARIAVTGSVRVPALFAVEALPSVWQMTSTVTCETRPDLTLVQVFAALFPCGSITGAPKVTAMQAIAEREVSPRGAYCGALGLIRPGGHATFNVGIRTVSIDRRQHQARCGIGSGITMDSEGAAEYAEWQAKRRFLLRATAHFSLLETLLLRDGSYGLLERHLARLASSAAHFGILCVPARVQAALQAWANAHPQGDWRVRLLVDRQGAIQVEGFPQEPTPPHIRVALAAAPVRSDDEFLRHKTTERSAYTAQAVPEGCFDLLLWNERDELTEFTRGNVVVELDGRLLTPALEAGLLNGVLRQDMLDRGLITESVIRRTDLARATGLYFINGLRGRIAAELTGAPWGVLAG